MLFTVRLKDNKEFVRLYGKGAFVSCGMCTVYYRRNGRKENRIGISTGKKIGNAVMRSRARRVIRHRVQVLSHQHIFQKKGHSCHERPSEAEEDC